MVTHRRIGYARYLTVPMRTCGQAIVLACVYIALPIAVPFATLRPGAGILRFRSVQPENSDGPVGSVEVH